MSLDLKAQDHIYFFIFFKSFDHDINRNGAKGGFPSEQTKYSILISCFLPCDPFYISTCIYS